MTAARLVQAEEENLLCINHNHSFGCPRIWHSGFACSCSRPAADRLRFAVGQRRYALDCP